MLGPIVRSTGLLKDALWLDVIEASCIYGFAAVLLLIGTFGVVAKSNVASQLLNKADSVLLPTDGTDTIGLMTELPVADFAFTEQVFEDIDALFKYVMYIIASFGFGLLFIGFSVSTSMVGGAMLIKNR